MSLKLSIFICVAAVLALVIPAAADNTGTDNSTATIHGEVYSLDTFEPLDNAVVSINSTPAQSMVAKYGMYSFELEPGNYTITAKYYQNSTITYSVDETVNIRNKGNYVHDLLLLPVYAEELMGSSSANESSKSTNLSSVNIAADAAISNINSSRGENTTNNSSFYTPPVYFLFIALTLIILSGAGYQFFRKEKKIDKISQEDKVSRADRIVQKMENTSKPANNNELSARVPDKSLDHRMPSNLDYKENPVSSAGQIPGPDPEILAIEPESEPESGTEKEVQVEDMKKFPAEENEVPEIETQDLKKKLPLPADLQEVMDIIRGQRGRITQKDLCSKLRCSDAKVSLMLADLERRELIEKFKKGRGNVVTLKEEKR